MSEFLKSDRVIYMEEGQRDQYLKLIACGSLDEDFLAALEDFINHQRQRLLERREGSR